MTDKRKDPVYVFAAQVLSSISHGTETIPTPDDLTHDNICFALDKLDVHLNRARSQEETQELLRKAWANIEDLERITDPSISHLVNQSDWTTQILCKALNISEEEAKVVASKMLNELRNRALTRLKERKHAES